MTKVEGLKDFFDRLDRVEKAYKKLPNELAAISVRFTKERFRDQAWMDRTRNEWPARKRRRPGTKKRSQTLLVDTGRLKRSIRKIHASRKYIMIGTDVPYASIHNEGGTIDETVTVKKHKRKINKNHRVRKTSLRTRKTRTTTERITVGTTTVESHKRKMNTTIPQRQFVGNSHALNVRLINHSKKRFDEALKK
jgi:phage gpG-like protein